MFLSFYYSCMNKMMKVELPLYREIPDVGLYLDQAVKYINGILAPYPYLQVTGSMLSNYVKLKIVPRGMHKMYSRDQIVMFLFVALSKPVLSMEQIRMTFDLLNANVAPADWYQWFCDFLSGVQAEQLKKEGDLLHKISVAILQKLELDQYFEAMKSGSEADNNGKDHP